MFQPGDKYIHFTKHGGANKGEIKEYGIRLSCDFLKNRVIMEVPYIITTNSVAYDLNGKEGMFFKISKEISEDDAKKYEELFKKIQDRKTYTSNKISEKALEYMKKSLILLIITILSISCNHVHKVEIKHEPFGHKWYIIDYFHNIGSIEIQDDSNVEFVIGGPQYYPDSISAEKAKEIYLLYFKKK
jgi:hypothetical protein